MVSAFQFDMNNMHTFIWFQVSQSNTNIAQSAWAVEYTVFISSEE